MGRVFQEVKFGPADKTIVVPVTEGGQIGKISVFARLTGTGGAATLKVYGGFTSDDADAIVNEVQLLDFGDIGAGDTYTLTFNGIASAPILYSADMATAIAASFATDFPDLSQLGNPEFISQQLPVVGTTEDQVRYDRPDPMDLGGQGALGPDKTPEFLSQQLPMSGQTGDLTRRDRPDPIDLGLDDSQGLYLPVRGNTDKDQQWIHNYLDVKDFGTSNPPEFFAQDLPPRGQMQDGIAVIEPYVPDVTTNTDPRIDEPYSLPTMVLSDRGGTAIDEPYVLPGSFVRSTRLGSSVDEPFSYTASTIAGDVIVTKVSLTTYSVTFVGALANFDVTDVSITNPVGFTPTGVTTTETGGTGSEDVTDSPVLGDAVSQIVGGNENIFPYLTLVFGGDADPGLTAEAYIVVY